MTGPGDEPIARRRLGPVADHAVGFVPLPPGEKGPRRSREREDLFDPDDPVLNAYLDAGHGCAVPMHGDIVALDADDLAVLAPALADLPTDTVRWVTGSRESTAYIFRVPGLDSDIPLSNPGDGKNIGHIKAKPQSVVVAPGSRHPSGNDYGPLHGDHIREVPEDRLRDALDAFIDDDGGQTPAPTDSSGATSTSESGGSGQDDCPISVTDVLGGGYPEGKRVTHPVHGSDSGRNFMLNEGAETFRCWRCEATGHAYHLIGMQEGIIDCGEWVPGGLDSETWHEIFDAARDRGLDTPGNAPDGGGQPVAALPLAQLEILDRDEARRFARKRGFDWPTTGEARDRLSGQIRQAMRDGARVVIAAPTALGKSYDIDTTQWLAHTDVTGDAPVIHLAETKAAREENIETSRNAPGVTQASLKGRKDRCGCARGDHDPADPDDPDADDPDEVVTIDGTPISEWFDTQCNEKALAVSIAHAKAAARQDQDRDGLPCETHGGDCPAATQWNGVPRNDDGDPAVDVVHATHNFGFVPGLVNGCNVVIDEQPDFTVTLSTERIQRAVTAFLQHIDAPVTTWEAFVQLARTHAPGTDAAVERGALIDALDTKPSVDWYVDTPDAHAHAPALARAIFYALADEPDANGRHTATSLSEPLRLGDDAGGWNRVRVSVVMDDANRVLTVRTTPDFSDARSVIGLDAHPKQPLWARNVDPDMSVTHVLDADERALWRRLERGLTVVGVGDDTRPLASGRYYTESAVRPVVDQLRREYGDDFSTAITTKAARNRLRGDLTDAGVENPTLMTYGMEKSRNDFARESVGYVLGCLDPGDDYVLNLLAELGYDARPERSDEPCTDCGGDGCHVCHDTGRKRAHGRGFTGPDADKAAALLASVRENHVAQAAGRYARRPDDPDSGAIVFVHTDAAPPGFIDATVPGTVWAASDIQRDIITALREQPRTTAPDIAEAVGCSREHVRQTVTRLADADAVRVATGTGDHGRNVYRATAGLAPTGVAEVTPAEISNTSVQGFSTWSLEIPVRAPGAIPPGGATASSGAVDTGVEGGEPPPDAAD